MIEAIKKEYDLPSALLTQILKSNPTAARSAEVDKALDERLIPLTEYQREEIKEALTWVSEKEELEWRMAFARNSRTYALGQLWDLYLNDPEVENAATLMTNYLEPNKWQEDRYALAELKAAEGDYAEAIPLTEGFENYFKINVEQQTELSQLVTLFTLKQIIASGGSLSGSQWSDIGLWAETGTAQVAVIAGGIMPEAIDRWVPLYDEEGMQQRSVELKTKGTASKLYPNPSNSYSTLRLVGSGLHTEMVEMVDMTGRVVLKFNRIANAQELFLDFSSLSAGSYIVQLKDSNSQLLESLLLIKE